MKKVKRWLYHKLWKKLHPKFEQWINKQWCWWYDFGDWLYELKSPTM